MDSSIKLVVGLGNPGLQYENTRHNVGFWLSKLVAEKYHGDLKLVGKFKGLTSNITIGDHRCALLLPETFMNLSGDAVSSMAGFYKFPIESILVIHDELDLPPEVARLKKGGGANGHNGIQDIINKLGSNNFWRVRIGIGKPKYKEDVSNYVLSSPSKPQLQQIHSAIERTMAILPKIISGDFSSAMLELHTV